MTHGRYDAEWVLGLMRHGVKDLVSCSLRQARAIAVGSSHSGSLVLGIAPKGQLRRAFLYYLERERAHPARPMLHYNSWYDIGTGQQFGAKDASNRLQKIGQELQQ